jgi:hypothetical protein
MVNITAPDCLQVDDIENERPVRLMPSCNLLDNTQMRKDHPTRTPVNRHTGTMAELPPSYTSDAEEPAFQSLPVYDTGAS